MSDMSFHWFDLVVLTVIGAGLARGRQRGMSQELLDVLQWLTIVVVAGLYYQPLGRLMAQYLATPLLLAYAASYLLILLGIMLAFNTLRTRFREKLVGNDLFGRFEYYLGMLAGGIRVACILVVCLALLNSKYVSPRELELQAKVQRDNFGNISFPTFAVMQQQIFSRSYSGTFVKQHLSDQLIESTPPAERLLAQNSRKPRFGRELDEVLNSQK